MRSTHINFNSLWTAACNLFSLVVFATLLWVGYEYASNYAESLIPMFGLHFKAY